MQINSIQQISFGKMISPIPPSYGHVDKQRQIANHKIISLLITRLAQLELRFMPGNIFDKKLSTCDFATFLAWSINQAISRTVSKEELQNNPELDKKVKELKSETIQFIMKYYKDYSN